MAQKEPSLIQKDLLATKLVGPNLHLLEAEEPCDLARAELYNTAKTGSGLLEVGLYTDTGMGQLQQDWSCLEWQEAEARLPGTARVHLCKTAVFDEPRLQLHEIAKLGLLQAGDSEADHLLGVIRI